LKGTVEEVLMMRVFKIAILAFISITALSGCLVEKKDPKKILSATANLRIYKANDFISYSVDEIRFSGLTSTTRTGTLTIRWNDHASLLRPGPTSPLIPVLEQVITLTFDGGAPEDGTVRYISQDAAGEITLHAIEDPTPTSGLSPYYWLSTSSVINALNLTESFSIFTSPMGVGINPAPISFNVMGDCNISSVCATRYGSYSDDMNIVGDTIPVTTTLGVFSNPFQISFNGTTIPEGGFPILDVRNICGAATTTHAGTMYVMPEIGVIQMTNTCNDVAGDRIVYDIKIRSASFY
jgi:hypothetical protein